MIEMKNITKKLFSLALLALTATSCTAIFENGEELAAAHQSLVDQITESELRAKIDAGEDFYLIDVRQETEFMSVSIPGAFNIPRGVLEFKISDNDFWENEFFYAPERGDKIIIYCHKGLRGILATLTLKQLGYTNVKNLQGGILSWDPGIEQNALPARTGGGCGD